MKNKRTSVGIFHRDELNRKAMIKLLKNEYDCKEIERWEDIKDLTVEVLVLASPELLYPEISFEKMKQTINAHKASVIMINSDKRKWWVYRMKFIQLRNPSNEQLQLNIERLCPQRRVRTLFFGREIRA